MANKNKNKGEMKNDHSKRKRGIKRNHEATRSKKRSKQEASSGRNSKLKSDLGSTASKKKRDPIRIPRGRENGKMIYTLVLFERADGMILIKKVKKSGLKLK
jgi:hypothetical protein